MAISTTRKADSASCGHKVTPGSSNVLINGRGAGRVGVDRAGGVITGPGSKTVLVNGVPLSLIRDKVAGHGEPPHNSPVIVTGSENVFAS